MNSKEEKTPKKKKRVRLKVGHIFKSPAGKGKHAYGQYCYDCRRGSMIRIFDIVTDREMDLEEITKRELMFPPIFVGLPAAIREGVWELVGFQELKDFKVPLFKTSLFAPAEKDNTWFVIDVTTDKTIKKGSRVPWRYRKLERAGTWSAYDVIKRIENGGENPYEAWK